MNILIFGFGFLGRPVAEQCYQRGANVRAVKRSMDSDTINLPIALDLLDLSPNAWRDEWAQYGTWAILLPPSQQTSHAQTVQHLLTCAQACGVSHILYTSSISVFGNAAGTLDESSATQPETPAAHEIVQAEQALLHSSIPHADILRLGGLYAGERHPLTSLARQNKPLSRPHHVANMIHRDRAVNAVMQALDSPQGQRLRHCVETPHLTRRAFYEREAKKMGIPPLSWQDEPTQNAGKIIVSAFADFGFQAA